MSLAHHLRRHSRPASRRLTLAEDLRHRRLTVAFRLVLAIPHLVVLFVWTLATVPEAVVAWVTTLARRRPPDTLARFLASYVRYLTRVGAYLTSARIGLNTGLADREGRH